MANSKFYISLVALICLMFLLLLSWYQEDYRLINVFYYDQNSSKDYFFFTETSWYEIDATSTDTSSISSTSTDTTSTSLFLNDNNNNNNNKTKIILFWTTYFDSPQYLNGLNSCMELNCLTTNNRSLINESSAIVFHVRDMKLHDLPKVRHEWQRYVFELYESPHHTFQDLDKFKGFFNWTMTYRLDSDMPSPYGLMMKTNSTSENSSEILNTTQILSFNKSLVAWMVSNCNTPSRREKYVKELQKYIPIDIYGSCSFSRFKCSKNTFTQCNTMIGDNYRFYLAFENSLCKDYITEKFYNRAHLNSVPVVMKRKIVENILPENSFIAADDFKHPKYLAEYLQELAGNDEKYLQYFQWKTEGYTNVMSPVVPGEYGDDCLLCRKLWASEPIKIYTDINSWWSDEMCDVNFVNNQLKI